MGVYTNLSHDDIKKILSLYANDDLKGFDGIAKGIQNTVYRVETSKRKLILTLYEQKPSEDALLITDGFVSFLKESGIPTAPALETKKGESFIKVKGKWASLSPFLTGSDKTVKSITPKECERAGAMLAKLHKTAQKLGEIKVNPINPLKLFTQLKALKTLDISLDVFKNALPILEKWDTLRSPEGMIHGDYFPDNVLWLKGEVNGVLDFNYCYNDYIFYDLAIALTAWSFNEKNVFQKDRYDAFLKGYTTLFSPRSVNKYLQKFLIVACFRFSITRLHSMYLGAPMEKGEHHNPQIYIDRYLFFSEHGKSLINEQ